MNHNYISGTTEYSQFRFVFVLFCFVVWSLSSHSRIFHSYGDVTSREIRAANKIISEYTLLNPTATEISEKHRGATEKYWGCYWGYWGATEKHWGYIGATAKHWGANEKHWGCYLGYLGVAEKHLGATASTEVASEDTEVILRSTDVAIECTEVLLRSTERYFSIGFYQLKKQEAC